MANYRKTKGTAYETAVVEWLQDHGFPYAHRIAGGGSKDVGDINIGEPGLVIECKNHKEIALARFVDELEQEVLHDPHADEGVLIIKRMGKPTGESYVVFPLKWFNELLVGEQP